MRPARALPGVTVTITSQDRGFSRSTVSDENGRYVFPAVPIGAYTIVATLQGFETAQADRQPGRDRQDHQRPVRHEDRRPDRHGHGARRHANRRSHHRDADHAFEPGGVREAAGRPQLSGAHRRGPGRRRHRQRQCAGALTSNNLFIIDAVDTTDPTTGTFGTNLNFEAIQEVSVLTSAVGAEYGRAQGAIVNVVTKSGTNRFEGCGQVHLPERRLGRAEHDGNEITGASLERVKFDKVNPVYTFTGGGPIWRNRAWFFGAYELFRTTLRRSVRRPGRLPEDFQQATENEILNVRGTVQLAEGHTAWVKYYQSPTDGFVRDDYWGAAGCGGEREALTAQNQTAKNWAAQWSGVLRDNWSMEAAAATYISLIDCRHVRRGHPRATPRSST